WSKNYDRAAQLYREYLTRSPSDLDARAGLASVLMWAGKLPDASEEFRTYLELKPGDAEARLSFGNVLLWTERYADALEQFNMVKAALPQDARADLAIAKCYEQIGQPDLALRTYSAALQRNPGDRAAADARAKLEAELPRQKGIERIQSNDNSGAARFFLD